MQKTYDTVVMAATGNSPWAMFSGGDVNVGVTLTPAASLTYTVQFTYSDLNRKIQGTFTRSGTTMTVSATDHGLSTSDSVILTSDAPTDANSNATYTPAGITDANTFTVTVANSGPTAGQCWVTPLNVIATTDMATKTAAAYGSYRGPITAGRLNVSIYASGKATASFIERIQG